MTKDIPELQSQTTTTTAKRRKPFNRNFLDSLNARVTRKLKEKSQRWGYNFETETAINIRK